VIAIVGAGKIVRAEESAAAGGGIRSAAPAALLR